MASERKTGLGVLPAGLLRPTVAAPTPPDETPDGRGDEPLPAEGQGRGADAPEPKPSRPRRTRRQPAGGEVRGRKLHLPDELHDRLWLLARQRRQTVSAVAADILDKNLPRFRVERDG